MNKINKASDMIETFLTNKYSAEEYKIKLKQIKSDNIQYEALLDHKDDKLDRDGHIFKNYEVAKKIFASWLTDDVKPMDILLALRNLQVVGISLKEGEDDPQVIFESINSTGVALTNSDLIRNFLLMSDHDQDRLFEDYWVPIESFLRRENDNNQIDLFFRQFVVMKLNSTVTERKVYQKFVDIFKGNNYDHESALKEIKHYDKIYAAFLYPEESDYSDEIKNYLLDLREIKQTTCYPFLMHIFADYHADVIDEATLTKVLHMIDVYLIRRSICNVPTNSLNGLFAYLYSRVFRVKKNKDIYYEVINKYLSIQTGKDAIPSDEDLEHSLFYAKIYQNLPLCRLIMLDIENGDTKEKIVTDNLTIEHIMPQTMSKAWRKNITEGEHDTFVHTLGNLSVTGYNSEMSNKSFAEKKKILADNSKVVILNEDVIDKDTWTVNDIKNRSRRLAKILLDKYRLTKVVDSDIKFEDVDKISVIKPDEATGRKPISFTLQDADYPVKSFKEIPVKLLNLLDQDDPEKLNDLIGLTWKNNFDEPNSNNSVVICRKDNIRPEMEWNYSEVRDGIYVMAGGAAWKIMHVIKQLLDAYGIEDSEFAISVRKK
ncbi:DUF262 domain-containing protein [Lactobacillus xujianguonis]|uniref:DUF262 domain-containing protein n=1 Tax=Lactobacillus xujianguonis TaxID=2495899 RepID=UPI00248ADDAE|nr:DUF262 domain-containing protein [Lactobacillus xujianguonis]